MDHGTYFEFVPVEQLDSPQPERFGLSAVLPGVPYELVLTSPAGVWACRTGKIMAFEKTEPPLFRLQESPIGVEPGVKPQTEVVTGAEAAHPFPPQPPHPRIGDSPAVLPGRSARIPSSARAGRE